jgi:hypothetical protein
MKDTMVEKFAEYCNGFYGKDGIYADDLDGGVDMDEIRHAAYLVRHLSPLWADGDSFDRERLKEILLVTMKG